MSFIKNHSCIHWGVYVAVVVVGLAVVVGESDGLAAQVGESVGLEVVVVELIEFVGNMGFEVEPDVPYVSFMTGTETAVK